MSAFSSSLSPTSGGAADEIVSNRGLQTKNSISLGLPPFLIITLFVPIDAEEDFFIGKQSHAERAQDSGKPFVRVVSQHLARLSEGKERRMNTIQQLEDRFRGVLEAKNCEWEVSRASFANAVHRNRATDKLAAVSELRLPTIDPH